jgi:hypothetical protein
MALLLRPLYERWLRDATQAPLPAWKRRALMLALQKDVALRCLAAELAEFSQEPATHAGERSHLKAPDMRTRVVALATEAQAQRPLFPSSWVPAGGIAVLLLLALVAVLQQAPVQQSAAQQANRSDQDAAKDLALPTATPLPLSPTPTAATGAAVLLSPAAAEKGGPPAGQSATPTAVFSR